MLEMIFSNWIVRGFLLYLIIGIGVAIFRRDRSPAPLPLALLFLPIFAEKWGRRWVNGAFFLRSRPAHDHLICEDADMRTRFRAWEGSSGTGLTYI